jgi:hypothetical protein
MKAYREVDVYIHVFLTSALDESEWSASLLSHLSLGEKASGTYWVGGWVRPGTGLDDVEKRKPLPIPELKSPTPQRVAIPYTVGSYLLY